MRALWIGAIALFCWVFGQLSGQLDRDIESFTRGLGSPVFDDVISRNLVDVLELNLNAYEIHQHVISWPNCTAARPTDWADIHIKIGFGFFDEVVRKEFAASHFRWRDDRTIGAATTTGSNGDTKVSGRCLPSIFIFPKDFNFPGEDVCVNFRDVHISAHLISGYVYRISGSAGICDGGFGRGLILLQRSKQKYEAENSSDGSNDRGTKEVFSRQGHSTLRFEVAIFAAISTALSVLSLGLGIGAGYVGSRWGLELAWGGPNLRRRLTGWRLVGLCAIFGAAFLWLSIGIAACGFRLGIGDYCTGFGLL